MSLTLPRRAAAHDDGPARRAARRDLALAVTRSGCLLLAVCRLPAVPGAGPVAALSAVLLALSVVALVLLPRQADGRLAAVACWSTLAAYVALSALGHDVPGAGSALGVLALVEAPIRRGLRGALVSGPVVTATALLLPQVDELGRTLPPGQTLLLVVLLLGGAVWLRSGSEASAAAGDRAEAAVAEALAALPIGVAVLDGQGDVVHANARLGALLGDGGTLPDRVAAVAGRGAGVRAAQLAAGRLDALEVVTDLGAHLSLGAARTADGRVVVHVEDVTAARREGARLAHLARVDRLTGLATRAAGEDALRDADRRGGLVGVLFVDLDGVKALNDERGHGVGDAVLAATGQRLRDALRAEDVAVRWGGDEFVLLLPLEAAAEAHVVAERVRAAVREPVLLPDGPARVTASIGLAVGAGDDAGLVARADAAMYTAKRGGGDRVVLADGVRLSA